MGTRSVVHAIQVLEAVAEHQPIGLSALARNVEIAKATVYRSLVTLEELGWLTQQGGNWSLSVHAYAVTSRGSSSSRVRDAAMGPLNALQLATGETIHLAVPHGRTMVVIERLDTAHPLRAFLALGTAVPMHASSTGQAYLAAIADEQFEDYLAGELERKTPATIVEPDALRAMRTATMARGYAINEEGLSLGITSVSAAVVEAGRAAASISISGPSSRITSNLFERYGQQVRETAQSVSAALGAQT